MRVSKAQAALPIPVRRGLRKLGADISAARKRRGITSALLASRAFINRKSLTRVEQGDPGVSMGIYASVLFALGLGDGLGAFLDNDSVGQALADDMLPKRVRPAESVYSGE
jgi:transcriptional regulator with XRE-family HTH domain